MAVSGMGRILHRPQIRQLLVELEQLRNLIGLDYFDDQPAVQQYMSAHLDIRLQSRVSLDDSSVGQFHLGYGLVNGPNTRNQWYTHP